MKKLLWLVLFAAYIHANEKLEIELKFKIPNSDELISFLNYIDEYKTEDLFHDPMMYETYYTGGAFIPETVNGYTKMKQYIRTRITNNKFFVTKKRRENGQVFEDEQEFKNRKKMKQAINEYGVKKLVSLEKKRTIYPIGEFEVVVDTFATPEHMKSLGQFIEVELKDPTITSYADGIAKIKQFLKDHGISVIEKYPPYIEIALNKNTELPIEKISI